MKLRTRTAITATLSLLLFIIISCDLSFALDESQTGAASFDQKSSNPTEARIGYFKAILSAIKAYAPGHKHETGLSDDDIATIDGMFSAPDDHFAFIQNVAGKLIETTQNAHFYSKQIHDGENTSNEIAIDADLMEIVSLYANLLETIMDIKVKELAATHPRIAYEDNSNKTGTLTSTTFNCGDAARIRLEPTYDHVICSFGAGGAQQCYDIPVEDYAQFDSRTHSNCQFWYDSVAVPAAATKDKDGRIIDLALAVKQFDTSVNYFSETLRIGKFYIAIGDYDSAIFVHKKVISLIESVGSKEFKPLSAMNYNGLGIAYMKKKAYSEALPDFMRALDISSNYAASNNPETAQAQFGIGKYYTAIGEPEKALEHFNASTAALCNGNTSSPLDECKVFPLLYDVLNNQAETYEKLGKSGEAAAAAKIATAVKDKLIAPEKQGQTP